MPYAPQVSPPTLLVTLTQPGASAASARCAAAMAAATSRAIAIAPSRFIFFSQMPAPDIAASARLLSHSPRLSKRAFVERARAAARDCEDLPVVFRKAPR